MVRALDSQSKGAGLTLSYLPSCTDRLWASHTVHCHQAVQFGTSQMMAMLCGWKGKCGSGITDSMVYPPTDIMTHDDEQPAYARQYNAPLSYLNKQLHITNRVQKNQFFPDCMLQAPRLCTKEPNHFQADPV